jgi:hypothetical protein
VSTPQPILVRGDATSFEAICDQCVAEKNAPHESGRAWAAGDDHSDVKVSGELPLDQDDAWVECRYGHRHLVVREGSERARNFGV